MKALQSCPAEEELAAFLRGEVPADQVDLISQHLDECPTCRARCERDPAENAFDDDIKWAAKAGSEVRVDISVPLKQLREALPEYEVVREIGRGGMGIVFEARHLTLNRSVALKLLPALLGAVREGAIGRFKREAELTARLKHNNIIAVYDYGEAGGSCYYTMELVHGRSLRDILHEIEESGGIDVVVGGAKSESGSRKYEVGSRKSEASEPASNPQSAIRNPQSVKGITRIGSSTQRDKTYFRQVAQWVTEIAEALHYAHGLGVIHRDIKPSNLMLGADGRMMITDFGLARGHGGPSMTVSKALLGTARYMCPEQVDSSLGKIDARADIYGLGATLYELLAFHPMFGASDDREVLNDVLNHEPAPPHRYVKQVPRELETICLKAVSKDFKARYQTAQEMADDLRRWLLGMPILAKRPGALVRAGKFVRRRKMSVALATAVLILGVGLAATYAGYRTSRRNEEKAQATATVQRVTLLFNDAEKNLNHGKIEDALTQIREGQAVEPDSVDLRILEAKALLLLKRDGDAYTVLNDLLAKHPDAWAGHYLLAYMLQPSERNLTVRSYNPPRSEIPGLSADEQRAQYVLHRKVVEELAPRSAEAKVLKAHDEADNARAIESATEAFKENPNIIEPLLERANRYLLIKSYADMLLDAERLVAMRPGWAVMNAKKGLALRLLGRYAEAEEAYDRAIELQPDDAVYWHQRAIAKCALGRLRESLADSNETVRLDPKFARAYAVRARIFTGLGQYDAALKSFSQALALEPDDVEIYRERSKAHCDAGHLSEGMADLSRIMVLKPDDALAYCCRGGIYVVQKQYDRAIADLDQSIRLNPRDANAFRNRAFAKASLHHDRAAIDDLSQAIELDPSVPGDLLDRSDLSLRVGAYERAIADLTRLMERKKDVDAYWMKRGMAYELSGAVRLALADYEKVIDNKGPVGKYARLWKYLALRNDGQAATLQDSATTNDDSWADSLFAFLRGSMKVDELLNEASEDDQRAEAQYYIGMKALVDRHPSEARKSFEACVKLDRNGVMETTFARGRLAHLDKKLASKSNP